MRKHADYVKALAYAPQVRVRVRARVRARARAGLRLGLAYAPQAPLLASASCDYDVAVCGGTLGILLAAALQHRGQRVVVIERGPLKGREQEWNISRPELEALVPLGVLTAAQADACVTKEFNPIRCGFHGSGRDPMVTRDILNCGVKPSALLECARANFERKGGVVMERAALAGIDVRPNGALLDVAPPSPGAPTCSFKRRAAATLGYGP